MGFRNLKVPGVFSILIVFASIEAFRRLGVLGVRGITERMFLTFSFPRGLCKDFLGFRAYGLGLRV